MARITTRRLKRTYAGLYRSLTVAWKLIEDLNLEVKALRRNRQAYVRMRYAREKPCGTLRPCKKCGRPSNARWSFICKRCRKAA